MTSVTRREDCLFCKIVAEEIPSDTVYRDDSVVAFRDIAPVAPVHLLIVPKEHLDDAAAIEEGHGGTLLALVCAANLLAVREQIDQSGYRLVFNVGDDGGNTVSHLHLHLIGGRSMSWPPG